MSCSSSVLWDSSIYYWTEETHLQFLYSIWSKEWKRLRGRLKLSTGKSTHTPWHGTLRGRMFGGTLGGFWTDCTDVCKLQTNALVSNLEFTDTRSTKNIRCCFTQSLQTLNLQNSVQLWPKFSGEGLTKVKQNTCMGMCSSGCALRPAACLSLSLSASCSGSGRGTDSREKSMVTRLVALFTGGSRSSESRGRGGTLTECLLVNLSFWWGWEVTEQGEGVWELWRTGWEESTDVYKCRN